MNDKPNFFNRAYRYTRALSRWIKAGRPIRDEAEIKQIFETCCKPCDAYNVESSACGYCGCRVNLATIAPLNKIAMATEECPLEKWGTSKKNNRSNGKTSDEQRCSRQKRFAGRIYKTFQ